MNSNNVIIPNAQSADNYQHLQPMENTINYSKSRRSTSG